jgi:phospholipid/cholesterol/gamma-HCH transport system permease protein
MTSRRFAASIEYLPRSQEIVCKGDWTFDQLAGVEPFLIGLLKRLRLSVSFNGEEIDKIDSAGAMLLFQAMRRLEQMGWPIKGAKFRADCQSLLELIAQQNLEKTASASERRIPHWLRIVGEWAYDKLSAVVDFLAFFGEFVVNVGYAIRRPAEFAWQSILNTIEFAGYRALPIVALLTFLVGVIVTYQVSLQLARGFAADVYVVDIVGMIMFREFGPLITAIIAAARTSTAFTAQIGSMKINEEIDAMTTMGVHPYERLVLPKFIGLVLSLPLLTAWANVFGILGAMMTAKIQLGLGYVAFIERFQYQIEVRHYLVGLVKVPVYAMLIALVGCFQGFEVSKTADSVGEKTTKSAVQAIFLIIVADAIFSIVFGIRGI